MSPTPKHQRCGHLTSGPDGFPCPHPSCWTGGVLQVVPLPSGPEEFWERLLYVPRGGPMFFGWRIIGEVAQPPSVTSVEARAVAPAAVAEPAEQVSTRVQMHPVAFPPSLVATVMGGPVATPTPVEPKTKKRGK